ncbi:hypothetical protein WN944_016519 [Citrus x changshan-huyou]|uniref:Uncharacterized protein n=1 Tax=Citrus x changshan-huyou TaxID=2935761 RepID=A0AAP0QKG6_9ROSI
MRIENLRDKPGEGKKKQRHVARWEKAKGTVVDTEGYVSALGTDTCSAVRWKWARVPVRSCPYPGVKVIRGTSGVDKEAEWSLGERTRGDNLREGKRLEDQVGPD